MNRMMQWESVNELNAFRLLEADPSVIRFSEQPFVIKYVMNGEEFYHYPDILFETTDTKHLWEVKPNAYASRPEVAARTALLRNQLPNHGYKYDLVLAEDLARKGRLHNIKKLLIHGRSRVSPLLREHIRQLFISKPNMTLGSIVNAPSIEVSVREIYRLILDGVLRCDLENPLTMESRLTHSDFGADQKY